AYSSRLPSRGREDRGSGGGAWRAIDGLGCGNVTYGWPALRSRLLLVGSFIAGAAVHPPLVRLSVAALTVSHGRRYASSCWRPILPGGPRRCRRPAWRRSPDAGVGWQGMCL